MLELVGVVLGGGSAGRLNRCSFAARPGEILGLVGPTGSGKTSALEVGAGAVAAEKGRVVLDGRDSTRDLGRLRRACGLVAHEVPGPDELTGRAWLSLWAELDGVSSAERRARVDEVAGRFELDGGSLGAPFGLFSRGLRRRFGLARLFLRRPAVYLLDGADEALDGSGLRLLSNAVRGAAASGATVVLSSITPHLPTTLCDRVVCLESGAATAEHPRQQSDFGARIAAGLGWTA